MKTEPRLTFIDDSQVSWRAEATKDLGELAIRPPRAEWKQPRDFTLGRGEVKEDFRISDYLL